MSRWGDSEEERSKRLEEFAMARYREAMTGGGGSAKKGCLVIPLALLTLLAVLGTLIGEVPYL